MSIRRTATAGDAVAVLQRAALQDGRLSFLARGVLAVVLSRPPGWKTSAERLARETPKEGVKAIRGALGELQVNGYLRRRRVQGEKGLWSWEWDIADDPESLQVSDIPAGHTESPSPTVGQPTFGEASFIESECSGGNADLRGNPPVSSHQRRSEPNREGSKHGDPTFRDGHPKHAHEDNALATMVRFVDERKLPLDPGELLPWCYRLGDGDPQKGKQHVDRATTYQLDNVDSPRRVLLGRLRDADASLRAGAA